LERYKFGYFFNFGLSRYSYFNPNHGVFGNLTNSLNIIVGLGLDYLISERIAVETVVKTNVFWFDGRYFTINLGLNYRIFKY
jgi:hypothetical protein